ncbi:MAG: VCBS repeat-containing protein, partial [Bacteroidetes bacterium]
MINAQSFTAQTGSNNPLNGISVSSKSNVAFVDIDKDGDMDAFMGSGDGTVYYYKNTGTIISPTFTQQTGSGNPFNGVDVGTDSAPTFVDLDKDGDMDAFIGANDGTLYYYKNTGNATSPTFTPQTGSSNPLNGADFGTDAMPIFVDIDKDGDMDAFIGANDGTIYYEENTGTPLSPSFTLRTGSSNPFNGVDVGLDSAPSFADVDRDGDLDAFIGADDGTIYHYKNTGNIASATFTQQTGSANLFNGTDVGSDSAPAFVDIDRDGDFDAFIGELSGTFNYYSNSTSVHSPSYSWVSTNIPLAGVDVGDRAHPAMVDIDCDGDLDLFIGDYSSGAISYYKNTGTPTSPTFTAQSGSNNPLNSVNHGAAPVIAFVDIDSDGDMDFFMGNSDGYIRYFENTGTPLSPTFVERSGSANPWNVHIPGT